MDPLEAQTRAIIAAALIIRGAVGGPVGTDGWWDGRIQQECACAISPITCIGS